MKSGKQQLQKAMEVGVLEGLRAGTVSVSHLFLTSYPKLDLTEREAMLVIHLLAFKEKENKTFPTPDELSERMSGGKDNVIEALQLLMKNELLRIEESVDPSTGIRYEGYDLDPLFLKLASMWTSDNLARLVEAERKPAAETSLFSIFEKEFARPLTPMELETISSWLDQDSYKEELILAALKEAVFAGKVHFRYIDRILLDWQRNRIFTVEQAKEHRQNFRGR